MKHYFLLAAFIGQTFTSALYAQNIRFEDIFKGGYSPKGVSAFNSMQDGNYYSQLNYGNESFSGIMRYAFQSGNLIDTLLSAAQLSALGSPGLRVEDYRFAAGERFILLMSASEKIYRHSYRSLVHLYDRQQRTLKLLSENKVMYPEISPDGKYATYVYENNLYLLELATMKTSAITRDGKPNAIINGATDWVYEEEFALVNGYQWSPNGKYLAYYRFDEGQVKEFSMDIFGTLYPRQDRFKYPKAGEDNSLITLHLFEPATGRNVKLNTNTHTVEKTIDGALKVGNSMPDMDENPQDVYFPRIHWNKQGSTLFIQKLNRLQNYLQLIKVDPTTGNTIKVMEERSPTYLEVHDLYFPDEQHFLFLSDRDGWRHVYRYTQQGKLVGQLTNGKWDVESIEGVDLKNGLLYFVSSLETPMNRYLCKVKIKGGGFKQITLTPGVHQVAFNADYTYYADSYSDLNTPSQYGLYNASGKLVRTLEQNEQLRAKLDAAGLSKATFIQVPNAEGLLLNGWMIKPANFDSSRKYPVLMYVYGGPGAQTVMNSWAGANYLWYQYLASKGYIVVSVDNRGTGARGAAFRTATYKQLGKLEIEDQMAAARWLGTRSWVDASRIGIWGWSYGGYMASLGITKGAEVFKAAIAVAPVTNWRYYDNIYTERYMQRPVDNAAGYDDNSPINFIDRIKGKYLIIHGTADDNVHFQNSVEMVNAMINKNIPFDAEYYPNKNHSIGGATTRLHLYSRMTRFILENL